MNSVELRLLRRPLLTEKTNRLRENKNLVVFEVERTATKPQIKNAIEHAFKVKVLSLNTMMVPGKVKKMGRYEGRRPAWKKIVATLRPEDNIELFEGV